MFQIVKCPVKRKTKKQFGILEYPLDGNMIIVDNKHECNCRAIALYRKQERMFVQ